MAIVDEAGPSDTADDTTSGKYQSSNTSAIQVFLHSCFNCTHSPCKKFSLEIMFNNPVQLS